MVEIPALEPTATATPVTRSPESRTLNERVYNTIREDILSGRLIAGSRLPFAQLHRQYDVGTGTLREALARLVSDNLVVGEGQKGFHVAPISCADLLDITRMRCRLEADALRDSIAHGDDEWEAAVVAAMHRLTRFHQRSTGVPPLLSEQGSALHRVFHLTLFDACRSRWLRRLVLQLYDQSERYRRLSSIKQSPERDSDAEHREIVEATLARRPDEAAALLVGHIERTTRELTANPGLFGVG
jgi:GntR family transcriptional regulator, carbon starvation induced regulator